MNNSALLACKEDSFSLSVPFPLTNLNITFIFNFLISFFAFCFFILLSFSSFSPRYLCNDFCACLIVCILNFSCTELVYLLLPLLYHGLDFIYLDFFFCICFLSLPYLNVLVKGIKSFSPLIFLPLFLFLHFCRP